MSAKGNQTDISDQVGRAQGLCKHFGIGYDSLGTILNTVVTSTNITITASGETNDLINGLMKHYQR